MDETERPRLDALLDLLADEVVRRLEQRSPPVPTGLEAVPSAPLPVPVTRAEPEEQAASAPEAIPEEQAAAAPEAIPEVEATPTAEWVTDGALPDDSHIASLMTRLGIGIFVAVLLINIPFNAQGMALARSVPTS